MDFRAVNSIPNTERTGWGPGCWGPVRSGEDLQLTAPGSLAGMHAHRSADKRRACDHDPFGPQTVRPEAGELCTPLWKRRSWSPHRDGLSQGCWGHEVTLK